MRNLIFMIILINNLLADDEICILKSSIPFGFTGDVSGKRVYTKEEFIYDCTVTNRIKGACIEHKDTLEVFDINQTNFPKVSFVNKDFSGSMGEMLAIVQGMDKINHLWSGYHGICQYGYDDGNFDWASDPFVLASYAMQAYGIGASGAASNAASTAAKDAATNSANVAAKEAAKSAAKKAAEESAKYMSKSAICAAGAGLDLAKTVNDYVDDGEPCDPIDEFCDEETAEGDEEIFTLPEDKYNNLIANNPEMIDYVHVVSGTGTGTVQIIIKKPPYDSTNEGDMQKAKDAQKKIKELMLKIRAAMIAIQTAQCMANDGANASSASEGDDSADILSAKNLAMMAINAINPAVGMAISIASNVYESLQKVDTCSDLDDAKEKGDRHLSTYYANKLDQCHFIEDVTTGGEFSEKTTKRYCCYDNKITKTLVEQMKAQMAKDWQHCSDISLNELQNASFSACDESALDSSINGINIDAYATQSEREQAYQFQHKCIDIREYMDYMMKTFGGEDMLIDDSTIKETIEDLKVD